MKTTIQPEVTVHIPKVNLTLQDVGFLRSLSGPQKITCYIPRTNESRLKILGLVKDAEIPALASVVVDADKKLELLVIKAKEYLDTGKWDKLRDTSYELSKEESRKVSHTGTVLTDLGRQLLSEGTVTVKMQKEGCIQKMY
jgi:hypothetical protein